MTVEVGKEMRLLLGGRFLGLVPHQDLAEEVLTR